MTFEALTKKLSPTLRRITRKLNGHFSFMDDQDLYQEALIHLWVHYRSGDLEDKTDSYILQGCYFHLKNYIRKTQDGAPLISLSSIVEEDGPQLEEILVSHDFAYDQAEGRLQIEAIVESGISPRETAVLFHCLEGMTTREIGKKLGVSHVTVVKMRNKIRARYEQLNGPRTTAGPDRAEEIEEDSEERVPRLASGHL
jgi:RNA polymerase sigma factor (sigma-70 family)